MPSQDVDACPVSDDSSTPRYHYVVVRDDLPLGVLAAQLVHAAGESFSPCVSCSSDQHLRRGTYVVVLAVHDENQLLLQCARLRAAGLEPHLIREPDAPYNGQAMALAVPPTQDRATVRRVLANLPLLKEKTLV